MNATMKHAAAVSKHGIMSTPNQPTYSLLLVDVTHSQNSGHPCRSPLCLRVIFEVVISRTFLSRAQRVERYYISTNPFTCGYERRNLSSLRSRLAGADI
jgi:hypothetical protein